MYHNLTYFYSIIFNNKKEKANYQEAYDLYRKLPKMGY